MNEWMMCVEVMGGLTCSREGGKNARGIDRVMASLEVTLTLVLTTCVKNETIILKEFFVLPWGGGTMDGSLAGGEEEDVSDLYDCTGSSKTAGK